MDLAVVEGVVLEGVVGPACTATAERCGESDEKEKQLEFHVVEMFVVVEGWRVGFYSGAGCLGNQAG